jgi:hypothetical protein
LAAPTPLNAKPFGGQRRDMRDDPQKLQRRHIRELATLAYERELARELGAVEVEFSRWRRGEINVHDLSDLIHQFHDGTARRLYSIYAGDVLEVALGSAIARGVLTENEASPDIMEALRGHIEFAR